MMIALRTALMKWRRTKNMTQFIYRHPTLLGLGIIVIIEDSIIVMKGEEEIYMMFEATHHGGIIRLAHRGGMRDAG
jgi:hypothetical protein